MLLGGVHAFLVAVACDAWSPALSRDVHAVRNGPFLHGECRVADTAW